MAKPPPKPPPDPDPPPADLDWQEIALVPIPESIKTDQTVVRFGMFYRTEWIQGDAQWIVINGLDAGWAAHNFRGVEFDLALAKFATHWRLNPGPPP